MLIVQNDSRPGEKQNALYDLMRDGLSAARLTANTPESAERWQRLSVFPSSFDLVAAAVGRESDEAEALSGLTAFEARSQLLYDRACVTERC
jgi:hypothetical protein